MIALSAFAAVAGLWLLVHPYTGIRLDSRIYMGRAIADLLPSTVGRDLMFAEDGQSPFSIFTLVARALTRGLGPQAASMVLSLAAAVVWFAAMLTLVSRIAKGRLAWAMLLCAALLPAEYGGFAIIPYGDALAMPRPFAEAGVLAALTAILDGRRLIALVFLGLAALFHPIMALGGFGVFFLVAALEDWRWAIPVVVGAVLAVTAGALHLPLIGRLFQGVDPAWLDLLHRRNPYLFPALWPLASWSRAAVQISTTLIAASLLKGRARSVFAAAAGVAAAGVALSSVMGDLFPSLLVLQMQPWRALWLAAALGAAGLGICGVKLWRAGPSGQVVFAFLAMDWMVLDSPVALAGALLALGLHTMTLRRGGLPISGAVGRVAILMAVLLWLIALVRMAQMIATIASTWPPGGSNLDIFVIGIGLPMMVLVPAVLCIATSSSVRVMQIGPYVLAPLGAALLIVGAARWDRAPLRTAADLGVDPTLSAILAERPGPVEWIDGDIQAWVTAGRANWASEIQGATIVFTRHEAIVWQARMQRLIALKLVSSKILTPFTGDKSQISTVSPSALAALCATPDGPAWVVTHVMADAPPLRAPNTRFWTPPRVIYLRDEKLRWRRVLGYAVTRCDRSNSTTAART